MRRYIKKPVVIEAVQWDGENTSEILAFCPDCFSYKKDEAPVLVVNTLEGAMTASIGDFIIKGLKGEFYPCKPDIFNLSYDLVTD